MRLGDCKTCRRADRGAIEAAHDAGETTRALARRFGVPEATLRRHLRECRRPASAARRAAIPDLSLEKLREIGALIPRPFPLVAYVVSACMSINVTGRDEAEDEAIWSLFDQGETLIEATPDHIHGRLRAGGA